MNLTEKFSQVEIDRKIECVSNFQRDCMIEKIIFTSLFCD